ncbi:MAG: excisionase family DNA-binding protein [Oscillospiraceae bacterium]|nr:excisionase family DNA-binding protein [Oscillospiraceae bacterium]
MKFKAKSKKVAKKTNNADLKMYLSIKESAAYTGLSLYAIRKLVATKAVPFLNAGRKVMINRVALEQYLDGISEKHLDI